MCGRWRLWRSVMAQDPLSGHLFVFFNKPRDRRAAILYSLIRTCERHQINAWEYLRDVLIRIATHPASRIDDLLPNRWTIGK